MPKDTQTFITEISGVSTSTIINYPCRILGIEISQERLSSNTTILDGTSVIFQNYALTTPYVQMNYECKNNISLAKNGNDKALVIVNYVSYVDNATTTLPIMTYGDILTNFFIFLLILGSVFSFIIYNFFGKLK